jgi:methylated-DNA-[protein]-cysteine S-methyltransferase
MRIQPSFLSLLRKPKNHPTARGLRLISTSGCAINKLNMQHLYTAYYDSPIGILEIMGTEKAITGVHFVEKKIDPEPSIPLPLKVCCKQLYEYFVGDRKEFSVTLQFEGTEFQKKVWNQLLKIPFGTTVSYKDIAEAIKNVKAVRAVGNANGRNNITILIPCHRVIAHDGTLGGYGGGLWRKEWLLDHEKKYWGD